MGMSEDPLRHGHLPYEPIGPYIVISTSTAVRSIRHLEPL